MVGFNKKAAVLAIVAEGVTKPKDISRLIMERHGQDIKAPAVSVILYNHRRAGGGSGNSRNRSRAAKKGWRRRSRLRIANVSPMAPPKESAAQVTAEQLVSAINFVRHFGGNIELAHRAVALVELTGLVPSNEG